MFVCGPTVYDLSHVGHAKTYTQFDLVARYLRASGYRVTYAQNLTDIDDKIIRRAAELDIPPQQLAKEYEQAYLEDMAALHNTSVDTHERALDHIDDIVAQVQALIDRGHAYQLDEASEEDTAIEERLAERRRLRSEKKFADADAIRNDLKARGITIEDTATGTRWWRDG